MRSRRRTSRTASESLSSDDPAGGVCGAAERRATPLTACAACVSVKATIASRRPRPAPLDPSAGMGFGAPRTATSRVASCVSCGRMTGWRPLVGRRPAVGGAPPCTRPRASTACVSSAGSSRAPLAAAASKRRSRGRCAVGRLRRAGPRNRESASTPRRCRSANNQRPSARVSRSGAPIVLLPPLACLRKIRCIRGTNSAKVPTSGRSACAAIQDPRLRLRQSHALLATPGDDLTPGLTHPGNRSSSRLEHSAARAAHAVHPSVG